MLAHRFFPSHWRTCSHGRPTAPGSPGDERGWMKRERGWQAPNSAFRRAATKRMTEHACLLGAGRAAIVEMALSARSGHATGHCIRQIAVPITCMPSSHAPIAPHVIRSQLKACCTRAPNDNRQTAKPDRVIAKRQKRAASGGRSTAVVVTSMTRIRSSRQFYTCVIFKIDRP